MKKRNDQGRNPPRRSSARQELDTEARRSHVPLFINRLTLRSVEDGSGAFRLAHDGLICTGETYKSV